MRSARSIVPALPPNTAEALAAPEGWSSEATRARFAFVPAVFPVVLAIAVSLALPRGRERLREQIVALTARTQHRPTPKVRHRPKRMMIAANEHRGGSTGRCHGDTTQSPYVHDPAE